MSRDKPHLLVTIPLAADAAARLSERFAIHETLDAAPDPARIEALLTNSSAGAQKPLLDRLPALRMIACFGVGVDGIDLAEAARRGIAVSNTPAVLSEAVADLALALLLGVTRRVIPADRFVRAGDWSRAKFPLADGLQGRLCGIVGLGGIGGAIARRAEAFGMEIAYHTRRPKPVAYRHYEDLEALALAADVLILALPADASTRHLIDARILKALGPSGYLINVARGAIVDEPALVDALRNRTIAGAGLDVFEDEPHVPPALLELETVMLLPHIGSATIETRAAMAMLACDNLLAFLDGSPLPTPVIDRAPRP